MYSGFHEPTALCEWTTRTTLRVLAIYEHRDVREVPLERLQELYPARPDWRPSVEVARGMATRLPQLVGLQGMSLMQHPLGGPYHILLATLCDVEVANVFVGGSIHHGHLWRLPLALRSAFADLTVEQLCSADLSVLPLLEAALKLLHQMEEFSRPAWLDWEGNLGGVFLCAKSLNDDGVLVLMEGLRDHRLRYARDAAPDLRLHLLDKEVADEGLRRYGPAASEESASAHAAPTQAPPLWGETTRLAFIPRSDPRYTRARRS